MAKATGELVWIKFFLKELGFPLYKAMSLWCDNKVAVYIEANLVFYKRTKHIELDCHFIRDRIM